MAKRMKMINKWGNVMAECSWNKSYKFIYRSSKKEAIIHDSSYFNIIELNGDLVAMIDLMKCFNDSLDLSSLNDNKKIDFCFYEFKKYPWNVIGPVKLLWNSTINSSYKVWLIVHPSITDQVMENLNLAREILDIDEKIQVPKQIKGLSIFDIYGQQAEEILENVLYLIFSLSFWLLIKSCAFTIL